MRAPRLSVLPVIIVIVALTAAGCSSDGGNRPVPENEVPAITFLDPGYAQVGQGGFLLYVHGEGFNLDSVIRWGGADRDTILTNPSTGEFVLWASIPSEDVATRKTVQITVFNPAPGGGASNAVAFGIYNPDEINPEPAVFSVLPPSVRRNQPATLTVHGTGFVSASSVIWKPDGASSGVTKTPTFVNDGELTVVIPAADVGPQGNATLEVVNPPPGGGTSNAETVNVL